MLTPEPQTVIDYNSEVYPRPNMGVAGFRFTRDVWGEFSNFSNHPVRYGNTTWATSEALYQAGRFPDHPDVVRAIHAATTPKEAKMVARAHINETYRYWDDIKVHWMHDVLALKLASNPAIWRSIDLTGDKDIVEISTKDAFWGAMPIPTKDKWVGSNVLGKLWMLIRERDIQFYHRWQPAAVPEYLELNPKQWNF